MLKPLTGQTSPQEPGLVAHEFHFAYGASNVTAIDRTLHHWDKFVPRLAMKWMGNLEVLTGGTYRFRVTCIGGAKLRLNGQTLITAHSNGAQNSTNATGDLQVLAGYHPIILLYSERIGRAGLVLEYAGPDTRNAMRPVPPEALWHNRGPCALPRTPRMMSPPCAGPRWALGEAEQCTAFCAPGYFSSASGGRAQVVSCAGGSLSPPGFSCEERPCHAPQVSDAEVPGCTQGAVIRSGAACTPRCRPGFGAHTLGKLTCQNGTFLGSFECRPKSPCSIVATSIPHASGDLCWGGNTVQHGAQCMARCEPGYRASMNLTCSNGRFLPVSSFRCLPVPTVAVITAPPMPTTTLSTTTHWTASVGGALPWSGGSAAVKVGGLAWWGWLLPVALLVAVCAVLAVTCGAGGKARKTREVALSDSEGSHLTHGWDGERSNASTPDPSDSEGELQGSDEQSVRPSASFYSEAQSRDRSEGFGAPEEKRERGYGSFRVAMADEDPAPVRPARQLLTPAEPYNAAQGPSQAPSFMEGDDETADMQGALLQSIYQQDLSQPWAPAPRQFEDAPQAPLPDFPRTASRATSQASAPAPHQPPPRPQHDVGGAPPGGHVHPAAPLHPQMQPHMPAHEQELLDAQNSQQERLLGSSWHQLAAMPKRAAGPRHHEMQAHPWAEMHGAQPSHSMSPWSDVRPSEHAAPPYHLHREHAGHAPQPYHLQHSQQAAPWSDVRLAEHSSPSYHQRHTPTEHAPPSYHPQEPHQAPQGHPQGYRVPWSDVRINE